MGHSARAFAPTAHARDEEEEQGAKERKRIRRPVHVHAYESATIAATAIAKKGLRGRRDDGSESGPQSTLDVRGSNRPFDLLAALDLRGGDAVGDGHVFHGGRRPRTENRHHAGPNMAADGGTNVNAVPR